MKKNYKILMFGLLCAAVIGFTGCPKEAGDSTPEILKEEICDSASMAGLTSPVASEEEFADLIKDVVLELVGGDFDSARSAAKTPEDAVKQIDAFVNEFVDSVLKTIEDLGDLGDLEEFDPSTLSDLKINFKFDKEIDIGQLKFSEWIDVISEVLEDFVKTVIDSVDEAVKDVGSALPDDWSDDILDGISVTKGEIKNAIIESISLSDSLIGQSAIDILDKYFVIKTVGLGTKININCDLGKLMFMDVDYMKNTMLDLGLSGKLSVGIANIDKFFTEVTNSSDVISVKGLAANTSGNLELSLTGNDVYSWITYSPFSSITVKNASLKGSNSVMFAICTSEGKGGYITISVDEDVSADILLKILEPLLAGNDISEKKLIDYANKALKIAVSVSDGNTETWNKEYTVNTFIELINSIGQF